MKALILSANAGQGHNSCANAVREAFIDHGDECVVEDVFGLISKRLSRSIAKNHEKSYRKSPKQSAASYRFLQRHPGIFSQGQFLYRLLGIGAKQLERVITEGSYDVVLCTHVLAGMMLTFAMEHRDLKLKTAFIATDYSCSPGVNGTKLDLYFIPHENIKEDFLKSQVPEEKIIPVGIPVQKSFSSAEDKRELKRKCGIDTNHKHLLMMGGSMGCGPMPEMLDMIAAQMPADWEITVLCGTNNQLFEQLAQTYAASNSIHIRSYEKNIPSLLAGADLFLTKPGGLSTSEAVACGVPMVLIDAVAGCEENNLKHFSSIGTALAAQTAQEAAQKCLVLMQDEKQLQNMTAKVMQLNASGASQKICHAMHSLS